MKYEFFYTDYGNAKLVVGPTIFDLERCGERFDAHWNSIFVGPLLDQPTHAEVLVLYQRYVDKLRVNANRQYTAYLQATKDHHTAQDFLYQERGNGRPV